MKKAFILLLFSINIAQAQISDFSDINFTKADNIAKLNKGASLENLALLTHSLTSKLNSDVEKFRAIYTWVCLNINGDFRQHYKVKRKRVQLKSENNTFLDWNTDYRIKAYKKLLKYKRTMCTGYAYIIKEMCFLAGIEAQIIDGYARTFETNIDKLDIPNHSWNAVKLEGKWYLCDATWSSGYMDENSVFIKDYNDGYFLTDPLLFGKNHIPIDKKWFLSDDLTATKFTPGPIVYGETFKYKVNPVYPKEMTIKAKKDTEINFSITSKDSIGSKRIGMIQTSRKGEKKLQINNVEYKDGVIQFSHRFGERGYHDIHLKLNDDIIATYIVNVTRL